MVFIRSYRKSLRRLSYDNPREKRIFAIEPLSKVTPLVRMRTLSLLAINTTMAQDKNNKNRNHLTKEDVDRLVSELQDLSFMKSWHPKKPFELPEKWDEFLRIYEIEKILKNAIASRSAQAHVSLEDFKYAIFEYSVTEYKWMAKKTEDHSPESFRGFFKKVVRSLLTSPKFMREYFGLKLITVDTIDKQTGDSQKVRVIDDKRVSIDETPEGRRPVSETIPSPGGTTSLEARENLRIFMKIVNILQSKYPKLGELFIRYYINEEKIQDIAKDYLRRGEVRVHGILYCDEALWTEDIIERAKKNLQNSMLRCAREKFNAIAIHEDFDYQFGK